jgi:hypothetical protein
LLIVSGARTRVVMRRANNLMCESLDAGGRADAVGFFCECGDPDCFEQVWLTPEAYDGARANPAWLALAPGHLPADDRDAA